MKLWRRVRKDRPRGIRKSEGESTFFNPDSEEIKVLEFSYHSERNRSPGMSKSVGMKRKKKGENKEEKKGEKIEEK